MAIRFFLLLHNSIYQSMVFKLSSALAILFLSTITFCQQSAAKGSYKDTVITCYDSLLVSINENDIEKYNLFFKKYKKDSLRRMPISELFVLAGKNFLDVRYGSPKRKLGKCNKLVVSFDRLDCVTYVESMLALSRTIKKGRNTFCDFANELAFLRYRDKQLDEYSSRLHYFSEWVYLNEERGLLTDMSGKIDTISWNKKIKYITSNKKRYRKMKVKSEMEKMSKIEQKLSARSRKYLPKENFDKYKSKIKNGDIILVTVSTPGLDVSHTGIAVWENKELFLMHASSKGKKVLISKNNLKEYLLSVKKANGFLVVRPKEI